MTACPIVPLLELLWLLFVCVVRNGNPCLPTNQARKEEELDAVAAKTRRAQVVQ